MIKSSQQAIQVRNLNKKFSEQHTTFQALTNISFQLSSGEVFAIAGSSGSGKTTLLNIMGGIEQATSGDVIIFGENWEEKNENKKSLLRREMCGYVFQSFNLFPVLTAIENIEIQLFKNKNVQRSEISKRSKSWLQKVGLRGFENRRPSELSGGQRQRVAIARAMAHSPRIIFADEPTSCLDRTNAQSIMDLLLQINAEEGTTIVFSSHDPVILNKAQRCLQLSDGQILNDQRNL